MRSGEREHLRDELAQPPRSHEQHPVVGRDAHLLEDLERRGERLGEDGGFVRDRIGDPVQIAHRQGGVLGMHAVAVDDAQHRATLAVRGVSSAAGVALTARRIDLSHHPRTDPRLFRALDHLTHELVAEHAGVGVVAAHKLEIGAAYA